MSHEIETIERAALEDMNLAAEALGIQSIMLSETGRTGLLDTAFLAETLKLPELTPAMNRRLKSCFDHGKRMTSQDKPDFDYANTMFTECIIKDPANFFASTNPSFGGSFVGQDGFEDDSVELGVLSQHAFDGGHQVVADLTASKGLEIAVGTRWVDDAEGKHAYLVEKMPPGQLSRLIDGLMAEAGTQ